MAAVPLNAKPRPLLRGWIHAVAALASPLALVWLVLAADSPRGHVGAAVFGASLVVVFTSSAAFHLVQLGPRSTELLRRIDHSAIYVAVAGAYTPFCLQVLGLGWGISILSVVGGLALLGIAMKQAWPHSPRWLSVTLYLGVSWVAIVAAPVILARLDASASTLVLGAGVTYSVGALCYAWRRPNPFPTLFGFHEVFHTAVVVASAMLFAVVLTDVLPR